MKQVAFLSLGIASLLCSCSRSLTDIGYHTYPINTSVHVENRSNAAPPMGQNSGYVTMSGEYYLYNFISDVDLEYFYKSRVLIRAAVIQEFYSKMNEQEFQKKAFDKQYASFCSPQILAAVKKWTGDSKLGGWQIFKPYPGLDMTNTKYELTYEGDDWYNITPAGDDTKVRLRVLLTGNKLQPVVVKVENPSFGINIASSSKEGKGFNFGHGWIANGYDKYRRSESYMAMLAGIIYDHCADKTRNVVTGDAILNFAKSLSQEQERLLSGFYKDLAYDNSSSFSKKYKSWLYKDIEKVLVSNKQHGSDSRPNMWQAFDTGSTSPTVAYEGYNWYRISGSADSTKDVHIQMVFCDHDLRPMIIGLRNKPLNIQAGIEFNTDSSDSPGLLWRH